MEEKEERYREIRALNEANRELRAALGNKVSNEDVRERLKNMSKLVYDWWSGNHLGYAESKFYSHGMIIKFKCSPYLHSDLDYNTQNDFIKKHSEELGIELKDTDPNRLSELPRLISNDKNKIVIDRLVKNRFPSARLENIEVYYGRDVHEIRSFDYLINDFDNIQ